MVLVVLKACLRDVRTWLSPSYSLSSLPTKTKQLQRKRILIRPLQGVYRSQASNHGSDRSICGVQADHHHQYVVSEQISKIYEALCLQIYPFVVKRDNRGKRLAGGLDDLAVVTCQKS